MGSDGDCRCCQMPESPTASRGSRSSTVNASELGGREARRDLDEQQHLADRRGGHDDVVVDREEHLAGGEVGRPGRHLHAGEGELAEGVEPPREVLVRLVGAVAAVAEAGVSCAAL